MRSHWQSHREFLNYQTQQTDEQALLEAKKTFVEIQKFINSPNEAIKEKLSLIEKLISGKESRYGSPLYRILYNQLKQLCELLLKNGYHDLCKRYAKLASYNTQIQKDPKQTIRWARRLANGVRENKILERAPTVFTKEFFQNGLTTLINSINIYLSNGSDTLSSFHSLPKQENVAFELILNGTELWVKATFANEEKELFYIQRFYDSSDPEGSQLFKFIKFIFQSPASGEKTVELEFPWETISKHLNRIMLPNELKKAFFRKIHGSKFCFGGLVIELSTECAEGVLRELRERHLKSHKCKG